MEKISAVYKITNTITGDFYIGSSKDVKQRWACHKYQSRWKKCSNNPMYLDMQKYGTDKFELQILAEVEIDKLKEIEQKFIELLKPTYNSIRADGWDVERRKKYMKEYEKSDKYKKYKKEYHKEYNKSDKRKKYKKEYNNKLCLYNGETLTLCALSSRFMRRGIPHPTAEAKKYINNNNPIEFYDVYP